MRVHSPRRRHESQWIRENAREQRKRGRISRQERAMVTAVSMSGGTPVLRSSLSTSR